MEPLNDDELNQLLARWKAPDAPAGLAARVLPQRGPWWSWLLNGSIRIPVPIGLAIVAAIVIFWIYSSGSPREASQATCERDPFHSPIFNLLRISNRES